MAAKSLKEIVKKYVDAQIYWYRFEKQFDPAVVEKYAEAIGRLETELRQNGVNNEQIDQLIYYAKYFHSIKVTKMSDNLLRYIKQKVFPSFS